MLFIEDFPLVNDSLAFADSAGEIYIQDTTGPFFQKSHVVIEQVYLTKIHPDWITYFLLFSALGIAMVWHYLPEQLVKIFSFSDKNNYFKPRQKLTTVSPGFGLPVFFALNYMLALVVFIFLAIKQFAAIPLMGVDDLVLLSAISGSVFFLFIYRFFYIKITGFIFDTQAEANQQNSLYLSTDYALGILLLPVVITLVFAFWKVAVYIGILLVFIALLFRWFQTIYIGKKLGDFSLFHLFMYLCTLEIIPLLLLVKLLENWL